MQAVARVNRASWKDRVAWWSTTSASARNWKQAIAQYTRARGGDQRGEPVEFIDEALKILKDTVSAIREMLHGVNLEGIANDAKKALTTLPLAMNHLVQLNQKPEGAAPDGTPPGVKRFLDQVTKLSKARALAGTHPEALVLRNEIAFLPSGEGRAGEIHQRRCRQEQDREGSRDAADPSPRACWSMA